MPSERAAFFLCARKLSPRAFLFAGYSRPQTRRAIDKALPTRINLATRENNHRTDAFPIPARR